MLASYQEVNSPQSLGSSTAHWMRANTFRVKFTDAELAEANREWGCNCGPAALAAICGLSLAEVREVLARSPNQHGKPFEHVGYMNVTMMRRALEGAGWRIAREERGQFWPLGRLGLARVQWGGPWIDPETGQPTRWASHRTHWVGVVRGPADLVFVYDINSGLVSHGEWERGLVPRILQECVPRHDGTFSLTHAWSVEKAVHHEETKDTKVGQEIQCSS